jgi:transcription termination factor Rho
MSEEVSGVFVWTGRGAGVLRNPVKSFRPMPGDVIVPSGIVSKYGLVEGASVSGHSSEMRRGSKLDSVELIGGISPEDFRNRLPYTQLTAIDPTDMFDLSITGDVSMRVVDLIAPVGKGTRGLIVSPPKAGKTTLLQQMANSIRAGNPDTRIIVLLVDERPEEVTHFRRSVDAEVLASSCDQSMEEHVKLVELVLAHIRIELECGRDIVVFVDSLTRMARAFNISGGNGRERGRARRTMSGGLGSGALEIPRRFFGLARNIEGGGSVTIIASALVDTGSRMDQLIFEEFKGTGNSEIVLERDIADLRIFPAINIPGSGTRKEERLFGPEKMEKIIMLRRALASSRPKEAISMLLRRLEKYPTNEEFLASISL